ncbi:MAG: bifunctional metallophosphatase/5'-nucleotidase [Myxococcota bacterium]
MIRSLGRSSCQLAIATLSLALGSCLPLLDGQPPSLANQEIRLTLLHTSDIHSRLIPFDFTPLRTDVDLGLIPEAGPFGGAARMGALLRRERARSDRVLHLDSGDSFQGAPIFNLNSGEVEFRFLSKVRLDAAVVGNHEFDAGAKNFALQARDNANFPLLAANYVWDDHRQLESHQAGLYTAPYTIKVVKGLRVGIIGMANISSLNSIVEGGNSLQATPLEQNEAARAYVELLTSVTDLIVVVSHLGLHEDQDLVQGYEAFYEYGKVKEFVDGRGGRLDQWKVLQWFGPERQDSSVVQVHIPGVVGVDVILGGHLHVVLNPPQLLTDPAGRKVVLAHSGAFAKYVGRLEVVVKMPPEGGAPQMGEVQSHDYRVFPIDALWCSEAMHAYYRSQFWPPGQFMADPKVQAEVEVCRRQEDPETTELLQPYILGMDVGLRLTSIFAYAPRDIARRNNSTGGDSPLGNLTADSMRKRRRVEAEVALTNSLGIRDNLYAGPLTQESMFNVFPFENTINIMYLSGLEMQELFDFVAERSSGRGCQSQAQISGARFVMDCAQVQLNDLRLPCDPTRPGADNGSDCPQDGREGRSKWQCLAELTGGGRCWAHPGTHIEINGQPLDPHGTYKIAVNDYIAKGGSGFSVLKRNTTRIETGISLRDSLIGYMQGFCTCEDILAERRDAHGNLVGKNGQLCGNLRDGAWAVDEQVKEFCSVATRFKDELSAVRGNCSCADVFAGRADVCQVPEVSPEMRQVCIDSVPPGPSLGSCTCRDALAGDTRACGNITQQTRAFCENPTGLAVAMGVEDGRIGRRVK